LLCGGNKQILEREIWGTPGVDLAWWVVTPYIEDDELEPMGCHHLAIDDLKDFDMCRIVQSQTATLLDDSDDSDDDDYPSVDKDAAHTSNLDHILLGDTCDLGYLPTRRWKSGDYLAQMQKLLKAVAPIHVKEEIDLFVELLHLHTKTSKAGRTTFDFDGLAKAFNERVLQRPEGSNLKLKCTRWIKEYTQYLLKRVQIQKCQEANLAKVSLA